MGKAISLCKPLRSTCTCICPHEEGVVAEDENLGSGGTLFSSSDEEIYSGHICWSFVFAVHMPRALKCF